MTNSGGIGDNFFYNSILANGLAQLMPLNERLVVRAWLEKLHKIEDQAALDNRNDYMCFLLLLLQSRKLSEPFNKRPTDDDPLPLKDAVPANVYSEVMSKADQGFDWIDKVMAQDKDVKTFAAAPNTFLNNQPVPKHGVICYMAAFGE